MNRAGFFYTLPDNPHREKLYRCVLSGFEYTVTVNAIPFEKCVG